MKAASGLVAAFLLILAPPMARAADDPHPVSQADGGEVARRQADSDRLGSELSEWRRRIDAMAADARNSDAAAAMERSWQTARKNWDKLERTAGPAYETTKGHLEAALDDIRRQWDQVAQTPERRDGNTRR